LVDGLRKLTIFKNRSFLVRQPQGKKRSKKLLANFKTYVGKVLLSFRCLLKKELHKTAFVEVERLSRYVITAKAGITELLSAAGAAFEKKTSLQLKKHYTQTSFQRTLE